MVVASVSAANAVRVTRGIVTCRFRDAGSIQRFKGVCGRVPPIMIAAYKAALPTSQSDLRVPGDDAMQQMERAMLEQSNRKRATILAKTAVPIMAAAMLMPLEPAALIPSDGGANSATRLQQFAYGGHNFEGGIGKTFPDKQSRAGRFVCGRGRYRDSATGRCLGPADSPD